MTKVLTAVICAIGTLSCGVGRGQSAAPRIYHVSGDGNDAWSGQLARPNTQRTDGPFRTLTRARDAIRSLRDHGRTLATPVEVLVGDGDYVQSAPIEFTTRDSGTAATPVTYRATGRHARILGGMLVNHWQPVTDPHVIARLADSARSHIRQADLHALGVTEFGSPGGGGMELFCNDQPMTLARWPNTGFVKIVDVLGKTERNVRGTKGRVEGIFRYSGERASRWHADPDPWVHGYWFWDWAEQRHPIKAIDPQQHTIEVASPYHNYGYRKGQWYYVYNCLSELDTPGEWYLDRQTGILYFWPPDALAGSDVLVSVVPTLTTFTNVEYVTWQGFVMEAVRDTAIRVSGGSHVRISNCTIRNTGQWAARVSGGNWHRVDHCTMYQMGGGGVGLSGGDRRTLTAAHHLADHNHIHHFGRVKRVYQPGITLGGVGNRAAHNSIHDAPHMGMGFSGNDHVIELNEIYNVCYESNDAGAIYTGRNWTMRGTVIRFNYLHDISGFERRGCVGVYLDDMFCGTKIIGNVFYRVTRAAFIGGGRDCVIANNLFVDCKPAVHIDARALGWAHDHADRWIAEAAEKDTLSGVRYKQPPYATRYPQLVSILDEQPKAPRGNVVERNIAVGGKWDEIYTVARPFVTVRHNLVNPDAPFAHPERIGQAQHPRPVDFELRHDSAAKTIEFQPLPLTEMGLTSK